MKKSFGKIETTEIAYCIYTPEREVNPKAILHIAYKHAQYDEFAELLTANGIIVCGIEIENNDDSVNIQSLHLMYEFMRKKYRRLPYFMLGNSIVQLYMQSSNYGNEIDGVILYGVTSNTGIMQSIKSLFKPKLKKDWATDIPLSLPVLVIGNQDIYDQLVEAEINDITLISIELSESYKDILEFINRVYDGFIEMRIL